MELGGAVLKRVRAYDLLSRSEKSEVGRDLRVMGLSYGEIMDLIPVKKSTLATWCSEIRLSDEQVALIALRRTPLPGRNLSGARYSTQPSRQLEVELIQTQARLEAHHLTRDPFWIAGVVLYWGEGSKTQRRVSLANSDPAALRLFRKWAETFLPPEFGWRAKLNLHADNDEPRARSWWADQLNLDLKDFTKTFVKPDGTGHRKNHLPYGVCTLYKRRSTAAYYTTMAWIEFLQQYAWN